MIVPAARTRLRAVTVRPRVEKPAPIMSHLRRGWPFRRPCLATGLRAGTPFR
jgi:hypothetical protein